MQWPACSIEGNADDPTFEPERRSKPSIWPFFFGSGFGHRILLANWQHEIKYRAPSPVLPSPEHWICVGRGSGEPCHVCFKLRCRPQLHGAEPSRWFGLVGKGEVSANDGCANGFGRGVRNLGILSITGKRSAFDRLPRDPGAGELTRSYAGDDGQQRGYAVGTPVHANSRIGTSDLQ